MSRLQGIGSVVLCAAMMLCGCSGGGSTGGTNDAGSGGNGGGIDAGGGGNDAGGSGIDAGGGGIDAGGGSDAGGGGGLDAGTTGKFGRIGVFQLSTQATDFYSVSAGFVASQTISGIIADAGCTTSAVSAACVAFSCALPPDDGGVDDGGTDDAGLGSVVALDDGTITVTGGSGVPAAVLTFSDGGTGYVGVSGASRFFHSGDSLVASSTGGRDLPAFSAQTVVAPNDLVLTAPACQVSGCPPVDRTVDLNVAWSSGGAGLVTVTLETSGTKVALVSCSFSASAGSGVVPAAGLALLEKAGDPGISGFETIGASNKTTFTVGDAQTVFTVEGPGSAQGILTISR